MPGFLWGMLSIGVMVLFIVFSTKIETLFSKTKTGEDDQVWLALPEDEQPGLERRNQLLEAYVNFVNNDDMVLPPNTFSPECGRRLLLDKQAQQKALVSRKIQLNLSPAYDRRLSGTTINNEQLTTTCDMMQGQFTESFTDHTSGKVLRNERYINSDMTLFLSKVPTPLASGVTCACGGTPAAAGYSYICPKCGTVYGVSDFSWVVSHFTFVRTAITASDAVSSVNKMIKGKITGTVFAAVLILPMITSFFANRVPVFKTLALVHAAAMVVIAGITVASSYHIYRKGQKVEQHENLPKKYFIAENTLFLVKRLFMLRDTTPGAAQGILSPEAYANYCDGYHHQGQYILYCEPLYTRTNIENSQITAEREYVMLCADVIIYYINPHRELCVTTRYMYVKLYRNVYEGYLQHNESQIKKCPSCGSSFHTDYSALCPYCSTAYDLADYGWKIAYAPDSMLFSFGGITYGQI